MGKAEGGGVAERARLIVLLYFVSIFLHAMINIYVRDAFFHPCAFKGTLSQISVLITMVSINWSTTS